LRQGNSRHRWGNRQRPGSPECRGKLRLSGNLQPQASLARQAQ